jgi:MFS family permease
MADIYGRKWVYIGSMVLQLLSMIATFFSTRIEVTIVIMFFLGFSSVGRCALSFLYLMELVPQKKQTIVGTGVHMNNACAGIYVATYFWVISRDWRYLEIFAASMTVVCICASFLLPESPKFFFSRQRWDETRRSLNIIARHNKKSPLNGMFDEEKKE